VAKEKVVPVDEPEADDDTSEVEAADEDDAEADETSATKPTAPDKKPASAKKTWGKKSTAMAGGDDIVSVSGKAYLKRMERLQELEAKERERAEAERNKEQETIEKVAKTDWPKAKKQLETKHQQDLTARDEKITRLETRLKGQVRDAAIRDGLAKFLEKNPNARLRAGSDKHLIPNLAAKISVEWDAEAGDDGDFVAVDPTTGRPAADVIGEWLKDKDYELFIEPANRQSAGARGGGIRPAIVPKDKGDDKVENPFAAMYNRAEAARRTPSEGYRPSVALRTAGRKAIESN
jgi:hypothetical protein